MLHLYVPETILGVEDIKQSPNPQRTKQMKETDRETKVYRIRLNYEEKQSRKGK